MNEYKKNAGTAENASLRKPLALYINLLLSSIFFLVYIINISLVKDSHPEEPQEILF